MKKLMILAAIVCAAAISQASSVSWGLTDAATLDTTLYASGTAYLICVDNLAKPSLTAETAASWYKDNSSSLAGTAFRSGTVTGGTILESEDIAQAIGRKNYWLVIVADDEKNFAVSTTTKALNITTGSLSVAAKWDASSQMTSFATSSVPEPTSGLLLLLGVAGLALKRKRA